jgi:hypothetical protein
VRSITQVCQGQTYLTILLTSPHQKQAQVNCPSRLNSTAERKVDAALGRLELAVIDR